MGKHIIVVGADFTDVAIDSRQRVQITPSVNPISVTAGSTQALTITTVPAAATLAVTSLDTGVATVSGSAGTYTITGVAAGNTNIQVVATPTDTQTYKPTTLTIGCTVTSAEVRVLQSISVTTQPTKTTYTVGEALDLTGCVVTGVYNLAPLTEDVTSSCTFVPANGTTLGTAGTQTVNISYSGKTTSLNVTVSSATTYTITGTITNGQLSGDTSITQGGTANVTFQPNSGYTVPAAASDITVTNATKGSYSNGTLSISNPTGNVTITATCPSAGGEVVINASDLTWEVGHIISSTGADVGPTSDGKYGATSNMYDVVPGSVINKYYTADTDPQGYSLYLNVAEYDSNGTFIKRNATITTVTLGSTTAKVKFIIGRPSSFGVSMTQEDVNTYFRVKYVPASQGPFDVSGTVTNGTPATISATQVTYNGTYTSVAITPNEGYTLQSVTATGTYTSATISNNTVVITGVKSNITFNAVCESSASVTVNLLNYGDYTKIAGGTAVATDYFAHGCIQSSDKQFNPAVNNWCYQIPLSDFGTRTSVTVQAGALKAYFAFFKEKATTQTSTMYATGWDYQAVLEANTTQTFSIPSDATYMFVLASNIDGSSVFASTTTVKLS